MNQITVVFSCFENKYHSNTTYVCINYSKHALHMSEYSKHALLYNSSKYHGIFMLFLDMYNGNTMFLVIYAGKLCYLNGAPCTCHDKYEFPYNA